MFQAVQRGDVLSIISTLVLTAEKILQLIFVFVFRNYYLYISSAIIAGILNNILVFFVSQKQYPQYNAVGKLAPEEKKDIMSKIRGLFMYKIGNVVSGSADSVVISAFLGLTIMGKYGNCYYVVTALMAFLGVYYTSFRAGIGNSIVTESIEKNIRDFKTLQFAQNWIVGWLVCNLSTVFVSGFYLNICW